MARTFRENCAVNEFGCLAHGAVGRQRVQRHVDADFCELLHNSGVTEDTHLREIFDTKLKRNRIYFP